MLRFFILLFAILVLAGCTMGVSRTEDLAPTEEGAQGLSATPTASVPAAADDVAMLAATPTLPPTSTAAVPTVTLIPPAPTPTRPAPTPTPPPPPTPIPTLAFEALPTPPILVKGQEGAETWLVVDGAKRYIVDWNTFLAMGYREKDIAVDWQVSTYPDGPRLTRLVRGSGERVYWLEGGKRRHIPDMATFRALGHREADISLVPDSLLITWPLGEPLPSTRGTPAEAVPPPAQEWVVSAYGPPGGGPHLVELYTVFADGHWPRRLSYSTGYANANNSRGAWSPNGERIAFTGCTDRASGSCAVAVTGRQAWQPTTVAAPMTWDPVWSAAGDRLALWSSHTNIVYVVDADGNNARELATGRNPAWTTDGRIAFWAGGAAPYQLVTLDPDGPLGKLRPVESEVTVYDQRFYPWREVQWRASGDPWNPIRP